jgi:hypothetical protein
MDGGRPPPALFLTDAGSTGADAEAPWRRLSMPEQYAELAALLPGISGRVRTCSRLLMASSVLGNGRRPRHRICHL